MQKDYHQQEKSRTKSAFRETLAIIMWYFLVSFVYILVSDWILNTLVSDPVENARIQSIKGFTSLASIGVIFYFVIFRRVKLYIATNSQLTTVLEELRQKNETLAKVESFHYQLAYFDPLTGLINKHKLEQRVRGLIEKKVPFALLYIDIDDFGVINELKGHVWGDRSLYEVGNQLMNIAVGRTVARMSEDGFVVILDEMEDPKDIMSFSTKIVDSIKTLLKKQSEAYFYSASGGIATFPEQGKTYQDVLRYANLALSQAKKNGKDQIVFYNTRMHQLKEKEVVITNAIRQSLENNHFYIMYQPILDFKEKRCNKLEALIRWRHPELGMITPSEFIYLSEISGTIIELTDFVCRRVFEQISIWKKQKKKFMVSINISAKALMHPEFTNKLNALSKEYDVDKTSIIIEITESVMLEKIDQSLLVLTALKEQGYLIALDDFGSGYSSLTYLRHLPVDIIKIDRNYIANIDKKKEEKFFLKFVLELSHALNKKVVLEGVETKAQEKVLQAFNVDYVQGFLYHKPLIATDVTREVNITK